jgi:hypothetical protein
MAASLTLVLCSEEIDGSEDSVLSVFCQLRAHLRLQQRHHQWVCKVVFSISDYPARAVKTASGPNHLSANWIGAHCSCRIDRVRLSIDCEFVFEVQGSRGSVMSTIFDRFGAAIANFHGAEYDRSTVFPDDFDPKALRMRCMD